MFLTEIGFQPTSRVLNNLILSKYLVYNSYTNPTLKKLKLSFPFFEDIELNKSKLLILIINFIEQLTQVFPIIKNIKILIKKGVFYKCEVVLTKWTKNQFLFIFNEFLVNYSLSQFNTKTIKLIKSNNNRLIIQFYNLDFLFDAHTRRLLPSI